MGEYWNYIEDFIEDMKKVFPTLEDDWGIYIPEVKYLSPEPLVFHSDLALVEYPEVHFVGDALSARGITVSGAQGILSIEKILQKRKKQLLMERHQIADDEHWYDGDLINFK
jgi:uncharacterized FAD-dependent dehydrogenase